MPRTQEQNAELVAAALERANEAGLEAEETYAWLLEVEPEQAINWLRFQLRYSSLFSNFVHEVTKPERTHTQ
jgi:hypothetical protein